MEEDMYYVLGLEGGGPHVLQAAIRKAYRAQALVLHPDKRGNDPVAAAEFQKLQKAYEILNDEKARAAFDELLRVRKERFEKENKQSEKRRKMLSDLKEKERAHELDRKFKVEEEQASVRLKAEIARIRKAQTKKRNGESPSFEFAKPQASAQVPAASASEMEKTLKASWTCLEGGGGGYSAARLREIFEEFGQVEDIALRQSKSKKKSSALIVMSSKEAAIAATERQCGDLPNPLLVVPAMPLGTKPVNTEMAELKLVGAGFRSYEDLTLRKMRQAAERARLEKQMREEDEKDIYCLDADGSLVDAALLAAVAALAHLQLPAVTMSEGGRVIPLNDKNGGTQQDKDDMKANDEDRIVKSKQRLQFRPAPIALTCMIHKKHWLADPSAEGESLLQSSITVATDSSERHISFFKPGGFVSATSATLQDCITLAKRRSKEVQEILDDALAKVYGDTSGMQVE